MRAAIITATSIAITTTMRITENGVLIVGVGVEDRPWVGTGANGDGVGVDGGADVAEGVNDTDGVGVEIPLYGRVPPPPPPTGAGGGVGVEDVVGVDSVEMESVPFLAGAVPTTYPVSDN